MLAEEAVEVAQDAERSPTPASAAALQAS
jgi:hypothetical protein